MDRAPLRLDIEASPERIRIKLAGDLDVATSPELWVALDTAIAEGHNRIALDLAELSFVDSTGLGVLVRAGKELRAAGGALTLRAPGERVARLLEITRLEEVFDIEA